MYNNELYHHGVKGMRWGVHKVKKVVDESSNFTNKLKELDRAEKSSRPRPKMDLSSMTDQQLRDRINRETLERRYDELFNPGAKISDGRKRVSQALDVASGLLVTTSSALAIAIAIKDLKEKKDN